jgi:hypothetical protein
MLILWLCWYFVECIFIEIYCVWYWILTIQVIPNWVCFISPLIITLDKSYKWLIVIAYLCPFVADVIMHTNMSLNTCSRAILTVKAVHGSPYLHNHSQEQKCKWSIKLNMKLSYLYFQQNRCLNIRKNMFYTTYID